jgi:sphingomyelin phosphodiesterase acid-like 3
MDRVDEEGKKSLELPVLDEVQNDINGHIAVGDGGKLKRTWGDMIPTVLKNAIFLALVVAIFATLLSVYLVVRGGFGTYQFVYVNDVHVDPLYCPESNIVEDPNSFCRIGSNTSAVKHKFGQYGCDAPWETYLSMLSELPKVANKPTFILFGGDFPAHGLEFNRSQLQALIREGLHLLSEKFPKIPLLITIGNNEFEKNYGSFEDDPDDFASLAEIMKPYMDEQQLLTFQKGGFYYHDLSKAKLRLLLLNTVMYSHNRPFRQDPYGQFEWIRDSARDAKKKGFKVGIAMHVPPGVTYWSLTQGWSNEYVPVFDEICHEFEISFTLAAHCHYDMLLPVFGETGVSQAYSLSSPSISPTHGNNPAFRIMKYRNGKIVDIVTYYADLLMNPQDRLDWRMEYGFADAYGVTDLGFENLLKVIKWVTETGEGMWRYKERIAARASDNGRFYYCILKATTAEQVKECMIGVDSAKKLSPYNDEI